MTTTFISCADVSNAKVVQVWLKNVKFLISNANTHLDVPYGQKSWVRMEKNSSSILVEFCYFRFFYILEPKILFSLSEIAKKTKDKSFPF